jgi:hypothetical protein
MGRKGFVSWFSQTLSATCFRVGTNTLIGTELIEGIEFWGPVSGHMLKEWGMEDVEDYKEYEVNVWLVGNHIVKAVHNMDPLKRRPYSKASWEAIPGAFWGLALPEMMRDVSGGL